MAAIEERRGRSSGKLTYRAKVRLRGAPSLSASFERRTDAVRWAEKAQTEIRDGRHFQSSEAKRRTLAELITRYVLQVLNHKPGDKRNRAAQLAWWKAQLGGHKLSEITPAVLAEKRDELLASPVRRQSASAATRTKSSATVKRYLAALSHPFTIAMKEWGWVEDNPFLKISKPGEPRGRTRYLDKKELERLLRGCEASKNRQLHTIVVLAVSTGMRLGEILTLRRKAVALRSGQITLSKTKNGDLRVVPLAGRALRLLRKRLARRGAPADLLFPGRNPQKPIEISVAWVNAVKKAGITDFRFHDLRHCAATLLVDAGATALQIAAVLGNRTLQMVTRYAHVRHALASKVVAKMNGQIFSTK